MSGVFGFFGGVWRGFGLKFCGVLGGVFARGFGGIWRGISLVFVRGFARILARGFGRGAGLRAGRVANSNLPNSNLAGLAGLARGFSRILSRGAVVLGAVGVAVFCGGCTQVIAKKLPAPQNIVLEFSGEVCGGDAGVNSGAKSGAKSGAAAGLNSNLAGATGAKNSAKSAKTPAKNSAKSAKTPAKKREIQVLNVRVLGAASRAIPVKAAASVRDSEVVRLQEFLDISVQKSLIAALARSCDLRPVLSAGADDSVKITIAEFYLDENGGANGANSNLADGEVATTAHLLAFVKTSSGERLLNLAFTARASEPQASQTAAVTGVFDELIAQVLATLRAKISPKID